MSGIVSTVARFLLDSRAPTHTAKDIADCTTLTKAQVFNAVHYLVQIGALAKQDGPNGRLASVFVVADRSELERRTDGRARRPVAEVEELPPLSFFVDHDGDLQLVREGADAYHIPNRDAKRLVGFVCLQASAILMAGS
jgi:hypothetical protein